MPVLLPIEGARGASWYALERPSIESSFPLPLQASEHERGDEAAASAGQPADGLHHHHLLHLLVAHGRLRLRPRLLPPGAA